MNPPMFGNFSWVLCVRLAQVLGWCENSWGVASTSEGARRPRSCHGLGSAGLRLPSAVPRRLECLAHDTQLGLCV